MILYIEVPEPPAGWEYTGEYRCPRRGDWYEFRGKPNRSEIDFTQDKLLILRRREPVRESRWVNHYNKWEGHISRECADRAACEPERTGVIRLDYIDGKLVSVELEEVSDG